LSRPTGKIQSAEIFQVYGRITEDREWQTGQEKIKNYILLNKHLKN